MAQIDLTQIASLTSQLQALQTQIAVTTDPTVKAILQSQANVVSQQLQASALHAQNQVDSSNNLLDAMGLWSTLNNALGGLSTQIPSIIGLFKK